MNFFVLKLWSFKPKFDLIYFYSRAAMRRYAPSCSPPITSDLPLTLSVFLSLTAKPRDTYAATKGGQRDSGILTDGQTDIWQLSVSILDVSLPQELQYNLHIRTSEKY